MIGSGDRAQQRAGEILDAGLAMFIENGYRPIGVREVTERAGVSHGTFYNYFANKRQMLTGLFEKEFAGFYRILDEENALLPQPCTATELRATIHRVNRGALELGAERSQALAFLLLEAPGVDGDALAEILEHFREGGRRCSRLIDVAAQSGLLDPELDIEFVGQAWLSYVAGALSPSLADGADIDIEESANVITDLMLGGVVTGDR